MTAIVDDLHTPVEFERELIFVGELPADVFVGTHLLGEVEEGEGCADADVETLGEAVHGHFDVAVGVVDGFGSETCEFGAEDEGDGLGDVEVGNHRVVFMGKGGDDFVATLAQLVVSLEYVGVFVVVDPFVGTHRDVGVGGVFVAVFDDVDILHAEAVAAAKHGACVVRLEDVFKYHADVAGAVLDQAVKELAFVVAV